LAVGLEVDPPGMGGEVRSPGAGVEGLPAAAVEVGPLDVVAETGLPAVCVTVLPTVVPAATRAAWEPVAIKAPNVQQPNATIQTRLKERRQQRSGFRTLPKGAPSTPHLTLA